MTVNNLKFERSKCQISVVIPVFNDAEVLDLLYARLKPVLQKHCIFHEIIFVDDGSSDDSFITLANLQISDDAIKVIKLTENFGQANAIAAGLDEAKGSILFVMDSDLQDRPEDIPLLIEPIIEYGVPMTISCWKSSRDPIFKQILSKLFCLFSACFTRIKTRSNLGVFRAISRQAYQQVCEADDLSGTILSRFYAMKIDYLTVELNRDARAAGKTSYSLRKMLQLAWNRFQCHTNIKCLRKQIDPVYQIERILG